MDTSEHQPITVSGAARILECSEDTVRRLETSGQLQAVRTPSGMRIFERRAVEEFAARRRARSA
jgi:excisionase family DNA binding protein